MQGKEAREHTEDRGTRKKQGIEAREHARDRGTREYRGSRHESMQGIER
jgi:hypothetical protein